MEVFAAAPPCPSVFELAAAEVAAVIIPGSVIAPDTPYHGQIRARGAQIGGRVRRLVASYTPSTVASTPAVVPYRIRRRRAHRRSVVEEALDVAPPAVPCRIRPMPPPACSGHRCRRVVEVDAAAEAAPCA
uniref:Uncharacterized protein n=1 Tax=Oryza sativa subsp. japonica TaxID=39947 RepID=Q6YZS3_ORYSJ|nr:hypothetical protein [Oryza sativa Japonica Group]BAD03727.1 hypothetical protein [Oryza sativa Japonica Group]